MQGPGGALTLPTQDGFSQITYQARIDPPQMVPNPNILNAPFFRPGEWRLSGASADLQPFNIPFPVAPALRLTNYDQVRSFGRTADLTIRWDSAGFAEQDTVTVRISGTNRTIECNVGARDGQVTVPASLLQPFDAMSPESVPFPAIMLSRSDRAMRELPLVRGGAAKSIIESYSLVFVPVEIR